MEFLPPVTSPVTSTGLSEIVAPAPDAAFACLFSSGAKGGTFTALDVAEDGKSRFADRVVIPWDPRDRPLAVAVTWSRSGKICVLAIDGVRRAAFDFEIEATFADEVAPDELVWSERHPVDALLERILPVAPVFD